MDTKLNLVQPQQHAFFNSKLLKPTRYWFPILAALCLCACSDKPPLEVSVQEVADADMYTRYHSYITFRAVADSVQIQKITVNRGNNCAIEATAWRSTWMGTGTLKFGQAASGGSLCNMDSIKEVDVETDQGEFSFTF